MSKFQAFLASTGGDIWKPKGVKSIFPPWPFEPYLYPKHNMETNGLDYRCFTKLLEPGDMFASYDKDYPLSNSNIKATVFKHAAVYTGAIKGVFDYDEGMFSKVKSMGVDYEHTGKSETGIFERTVTHAISEGVVVQDLFDFMKQCDKICVFRPHTTTEQRTAIVNAALDNVGLEYNFDFQPTSNLKHFYCTELAQYALKKAGIKEVEKTMINTSWKGLVCFWNKKKYMAPVTLADDLVAAFPMVCCTASCNEPKFWRESRKADILRQKIQDAPDAQTM